MKVKEFVEKYNETTIMSEIKKYIPVNTKRAIARDAIDRNANEINGFIEIDNVNTDVYFEVGIVCAYTGLECDDVIDDYDALYESGLIEKIVEVVGGDYSTALYILDQEKEAILERNSVEAQVAKVAYRLNEAINSLSNKFESSIGSFDINQFIPEGTNVTELLDVINKIK